MHAAKTFHIRRNFVKRIITTLLTASILLFAGLMIGCSENSNSPMGSTTNGNVSSFTGNGNGNNGSSSVETELYGRVESINPDTRTMTLVGDPTAIEISASAEIVQKISTNETPIGLDQIYPGDSVDVRGNLVGNTLTADRVRKRANGAETEFSGRVIFVDTVNSFIVLNTCWRVNVSPSTHLVRKVDGVETPILLSEILVDDSLDIKGYQNPDFSVQAVRVRIRVAGDDDSNDEDVEFTAMIASIDTLTGTFTVIGRTETIITDANTRIFAKVRVRRESGRVTSDGDGDTSRVMEEIPFSALQVGFVVEVHANFAPDSQLLATRIELEDGFEDELEDEDDEREFKATITTINYSTREVSFDGSFGTGVVSVDAQLEGLNGESVSFDHFVVGQLVEAKGYVTNGVFTITRLERDNN
jgi:hypothetical protein